MNKSFALLGALIPFSLFVNDGVLIALTFFVCGWRLWRGTRVSFSWALPYVGIIAAWLCAHTGMWLYAINVPLVLKSVCGGAVCTGALPVVFSSLRDVWEPWREGITMGAFIFLFLILGDDKERLRWFLMGIVWGAVVAVGASILSFLGLFALHSGRYWDAIGREGGTFSDPNALGVGAFLIVALILSGSSLLQGSGRARPSFFLVGLSVLWLGVGLHSGSRAFVLGLLVTASVLLWRAHRRFCVVLTGVCVGALILWNGAVSPLHQKVIAERLPHALERVILTASFSHGTEAMFSRALFWSANVALWRDSPFVGIGFGRFEGAFARYRKERALPIGNWSDNPNSFYGGILSELGLLGVIAFIWGVSFLRVVPTASPIATAALWGFLVMLFVGPHLDFTEVALLFAGLLALTVRPHENESSIVRPLWFSGFVFVVVVVVGVSGSRGVYDRGNPDKPWIAPRAWFPVPCTAPGVASFRLALPRDHVRPESVQVRFSGGLEHSRDVHEPGIVSISIRCETDHGDDDRAVWVGIQCNEVWIPSREPQKARSLHALCARVLFE